MGKHLAGLVIALAAGSAAAAGPPGATKVEFLVQSPAVRPVAYLYEPARDVNGNALGGTNALQGCWWSVTDNQGQPAAHGWTRPTAPGGGGAVRLPEIDQFTVGQAPYVAQAACCSALGCGAAYSGHINWEITVP